MADATAQQHPPLLIDGAAEPVFREIAAAMDHISDWGARLEDAAQRYAHDIGTDASITINPQEGSAHAIIIRANTRATLIEQGAGSTSIAVLVEEGAHLRYFSATSGQSSPRRTVLLAKDAQLDWIDAAMGSARSENAVHLAGAGASAKFRSIFLGTGDEQYDVAVRMVHEASRTSSNMLTRAALLGKSAGKYRGLIRILPDARGCDAYQRQDTLLLGDKSKMDAEPVLEIQNDDVKCSHGVTLGQVDDEKLFYLGSRGLGRDDAESLIVAGFFDQILISMGEHGDELRELVAARLARNALHGLRLARDFPLLRRTMAGKPLVYLDSAATTQKPAVVIDGMKRFYETAYANVHRGIYPLAEEATQQYEDARAKVARFINAQPEETIFTRSTTDGINMIARSIASTLKPGDEIVVSAMEHHSNFVPWQQLCEQHGLLFKVIGLTPDDTLDMEDARAKITTRTKIVAIAHASNVLGTINPVAEIARIAHSHGAFLIVDGAQAVGHMPVDVKALDADFYAFSGHKMYGPEGIGVLYGKRQLLETLPPSAWGGEMVQDVTIEKATWNELPYKFEPGTPDITQAVGLGLAVGYIESIGWERIQAHERDLTQYALDQLKALGGLYVVGPKTAEGRVGAVSFVVHGVHAHDVAQVLAGEGVAVRAGHHCARPLHCEKGIISTTRLSIGLYNTRAEIDRLIAAVKKAQEMLA